MTAAAGGQKKPQTTGSKRGQNVFKVDGEDSADPNGQKQSVTARWTGQESQEGEDSKPPINYYQFYDERISLSLF